MRRMKEKSSFAGNRGKMVLALAMSNFFSVAFFSDSSLQKVLLLIMKSSLMDHPLSSERRRGFLVVSRLLFFGFLQKVHSLHLDPCGETDRPEKKIAGKGRGGPIDHSVLPSELRRE